MTYNMSQQPQPEPPLRLIRMDTIQETEVTWLWYPYIPYGKITIIQGDPGEGKTTLVLHLAAALTRGRQIGSDEVRDPVTVIYQTAEDGLADTVKPRLLAADADCSRVLVIDESEKCVSMTDDRLENAIQQTNARLVILDPIQAYLGADVDMHRANEIRPVMKHLGDLAEKYGCAIVLIGHMNKAVGVKASYRGLGSIDFAASARSVLIVARDRNNPTTRVVVQVKSSLAPEGKPIAFELDPEQGFLFIGDYEVDPEELLTGTGSKKKAKVAEELLISALMQGEVSQQSILERAIALGISKRTLDQVKKSLGVQSKKRQGCWYWYLPESKDTRLQDCNE